MSEIEIDAANVVDLAALGGARSRREWAILQEMRHGGRIWAARKDGKAIALGCLYPLPGPDESAEACFMVGADAAPHLRTLIRAMRLTIDASSYRSIVAICRTREGARIARALGFEHRADCDLGEVWGYGIVRRRQEQRGQ